MSLSIKQFVLGELETNTYVCYSGNEAIIIDPPTENKGLLDFIKNNRLAVNYIINTHGHFDHILGDMYIKNATGAKIVVHKDDVLFLKYFNIIPDILVSDGDIITFSDVLLKVIHTPGHSPGSISLLYNNEILFTGDTLFCGSVGRCDLLGGDEEKLISSIKNKLFSLDDKIKFYPGHGRSCTLGAEKKHNEIMRYIT